MLAECAAQELREVADRRVQVEALGRLLIALAEKQKLPRERGPALPRMADLPEVGLHGAVLGQLLGDEGRVVEDNREEVVEVMGDAAGEAADGLHPLRLAERRLQARSALGGKLAERQVVKGAEDQRLGGFHDPDLHLNQGLHPVRAPNAELDQPTLTACLGSVDRVVEKPAEGLEVVGIDEIGGSCPQEAGLDSVEKALRRGVCINHPAIGIEQQDRAGRGVEHRLPARSRRHCPVRSALMGFSSSSHAHLMRMAESKYVGIDYLSAQCDSASAEERGVESLQDLFAIGGFRDGADGAQVDRFALDRRMLVTAQHEDPRQGLAVGSLGQLLEDREPVGVRHGQIEQNQIGTLQIVDANRVGRAGRRDHVLESARFEDPDDQAHTRGVVVDDEHADRRASRVTLGHAGNLASEGARDGA